MNENNRILMEMAWKGSLDLFRKRWEDDSFQKLLLDVGLVEYSPELDIVGGGINRETREASLVFPIRTSKRFVCGFLLYTEEGKWVRMGRFKHIPEAMIWGSPSQYAIVCPRLEDMTLFLSQNKDLFGIKYSLILPMTSSYFLSRKPLRRIVGPSTAIFLGNNERMLGLKEYYKGDFPSRILAEGVPVSDLKAGNLFKYRSKFLKSKVENKT